MRVTDSIKPSSTPYVVGISGGSGSGKTYFAQALQDVLGPQNCEIIYQDNFYFDQSNMFDFDGGSVNFDHPNSIDFAALAAALGQLRSGVGAQIPIYDFVTHKRSRESLAIRPTPIILVDGILIFHQANVRAQFHDLVFFETPEHLRFKRRMQRDVHERGRTPEGVKTQFLRQVKPMHDQFVEPSKVHAKTIVRDIGDFAGVLQTYAEDLKGRC